MKKYVTGLLLLVVLSSSSIAQVVQSNNQSNQAEKEAKHKAKREGIKALKINYLKEKFVLTPEEAARFWPIYNAHEEKKMLLRKEKHEFRKEIKENKGGGELTDAQIEVIVDKHIDFQMELAKEDKFFHEQLKKALPIKKVLEFYKVERGFKKELMGKYRKNHKNKSKGGVESDGNIGR